MISFTKIALCFTAIVAIYLSFASAHNVVGSIANASNVTWVLQSSDCSDGKLTASPALKLEPFQTTTFEAHDVNLVKYIKYSFTYVPQPGENYCAAGTPPSAHGYFRWHYGDEKCTADSGIHCASPLSTVLNIDVGGCGTAVGTSNPTYTISIAY